jgi:non-heme chloroperoxidase
MQGGLTNSYESIKAFSETEFHDDQKRSDVPTLLMHGEDDQIVPINISSRKSARLIGASREAACRDLSLGCSACFSHRYPAQPQSGGCVPSSRGSRVSFVRGFDPHQWPMRRVLR